ncbi:MAG: hypothetical protein WCG66_12195 [bacterium]
MKPPEKILARRKKSAFKPANLAASKRKPGQSSFCQFQTFNAAMSYI